MLQTPKTPLEMIDFETRHHCAEDPETGAFLMRSYGRRKKGRPMRYYYRAPGMLNMKTLYAESDEAAVQQIEGEAS